MTVASVKAKDELQEMPPVQNEIANVCELMTKKKSTQKSVFNALVKHGH